MNSFAPTVCLLFAITISGAEFTAESASLAHVEAAIALASDGDTVRIPAGSATWSSRLTVTKSIQIIGAGLTQTIISNNVSQALILLNPDDADADLPIRFSHVRINSPDSAFYVLSAIGPANAIRFDHLYINRGDSAVNFNVVAPLATGPVKGVIDHSTFFNCKRAHYPYDRRDGDVGDWGDIAWSEPTLPGTTNMMYFEDCTFDYDSTVPLTGDLATVYGGYGGMVTVRFCTFTNLAQNYIDAHGDMGIGNDDSTKFYELYSNVFWDGTNGNVLDVLGNCRGGSAIYHDNTFTGWTNGDMMQLTIDVADQDPVQQPTNFFWWNNTWNGSTDQTLMVEVIDHVGCPGCAPATIILDTDYHLHAPESGQTYFPHSDLVYPHPLVTAQDGVLPVTALSGNATFSGAFSITQ